MTTPVTKSSNQTTAEDLSELLCEEEIDANFLDALAEQASAAREASRKRIREEEDDSFDALALLSEQAVSAKAAKSAIPPSLELWHRNLHEHLYTWRYDYGDSSSIDPYSERRSLWNYEEVFIDCSNELQRLGKSTAIDREVEILSKELARLNSLFSPLEESLEKTMQGVSAFSEAIVDAAEDGSKKVACTFLLSQLDVSLLSTQKEILAQIDVIQKCQVNLSAHQWVRKSSPAESLFGSTHRIGDASERHCVDSLYSAYEKMLEFHSLYVVQFLSTVVKTRDYLAFARRWLSNQ
jgi:hypothetical protein